MPGSGILHFSKSAKITPSELDVFRGGMQNVLWAMSGYVFHVYGNVRKETLLEIVGSVTVAP